MSLNKIDYRKLIYILISGIIYFATAFTLEMLVQSTLDWIFRTMGISGILAFEDAQNAYYIIRLGIVYLSSGYLGGLYAGYKIKENLKLNMTFPSLIGFLLIFTMQYFLGYSAVLKALSLIGFAKIIAMPLIVSLVGSYLGGYTVNWQVEEKPKEEKISLIFKES
ncbi:MAG: hypothetical protein QXK89_04890 [Candidatus Bathyarchaeia archaeon]